MLGALGLACTWELLVRWRYLGSGVAAPSGILAVITDDVQGERLRTALSHTMGSALTGLTVGVSIALVLAVVGLIVPRADRITSGVGVLSHALPIVAVGPVLVSLVDRAIVPTVLSALAVVFVAFVPIAAGLRSPSSAQHELFDVFGGRRLVRLVRLEAPAAVPYALEAVALGTPAAVLGSIIGEWFGSETGVGPLLISSMQTYQIPELWAAGLVAAAPATIAYGVLRRLRRTVGEVVAADATLGPRHAGGDTDVRPVRRFVGLVVTIGAVCGATILAWWAWIAHTGVSAFVVPRPSTVLQEFAREPDLIVSQLGWTVAIAAAGLIIGVLAALVAAVTVWWSSLARATLMPILLAAQSVPMVAMVPVLAQALGYGDRAVIVIAALLAYFPTFSLVVAAMWSRPSHRDLFAVFTPSRGKRLRYLALPSAAPALAVSLSFSVVAAIAGAIVAEYLIGRRGLGYLFVTAQVRSNFPQAWAAAIAAIVLSLLAFAVARATERRVTERFS